MRLETTKSFLLNLLDKKYYVNTDSNANISPGYPRAIRGGLIARF